MKRHSTVHDAMEDEILYFPGGKLTMAQLNGLFKVLPIDITFIDDEDINRFFTNEGKVFSRPLSALDQSAYEYHSKRAKPMEKELVEDFNSVKAHFTRTLASLSNEESLARLCPKRSGGGILMKEKTGEVFSIAHDNTSVPGCTISKEVHGGENYISYFSLAIGTDISAEIYPYHKMIIVACGSLEVYGADGFQKELDIEKYCNYE